MNPLFSAMPESILSTVFRGDRPIPHLVSPPTSAETSPTSKPKPVVSSSTSTIKTKKSSSSKSSDNRGKRKRTPKAADAPRRPLSAYNLFFKRERSLILVSLNNENDKAGDSSQSLSDSSDAESNDAKQAKQPVFVGGSYSGMLSTPQGQTVVQPVDGPRPRQLKRSHRRTHGKISFADMAKLISIKWKALDEDSRRPFVEQAKVEKEQYQREVAKYKARKAQEAQEQQAQVQANEHMLQNMTSAITAVKTSTSTTTANEDGEELGPKTKKVKTTKTKKVESAKSSNTTSTNMPKLPSSLVALNDQMEDFLCDVDPTAVSPGTSDDNDEEEGPIVPNAEEDPFHIDIKEVDANDILSIFDAAMDREGDMALPMNTVGAATTKSLPPKKAIALRRSSLLMMMDEEVNANTPTHISNPKVVPAADTTGLNLTMPMPGMPAIPPGVDTLRFMEGYLHQQQLQIARNNDFLRKARMVAMMANNGGAPPAKKEKNDTPVTLV